MTEYRDIRVFLRDRRYRGLEYQLTIWVNVAGNYSLEEVAVAGIHPRKAMSEARFDSLELTGSSY